MGHPWVRLIQIILHQQESALVLEVTGGAPNEACLIPDEVHGVRQQDPVQSCCRKPIVQEVAGRLDDPHVTKLIR